jgi:hypothetical protein
MLELLRGPLAEFYEKFPFQTSLIYFLTCLVLSLAGWYLLMVYPSGKNTAATPSLNKADKLESITSGQKADVKNSPGATII